LTHIIHPRSTNAPQRQSSLADFLLRLSQCCRVSQSLLFSPNPPLKNTLSSPSCAIRCALFYINTAAPTSAAPATPKPCTHTPPLPTLGVAVADVVLDAVPVAAAVLGQVAVVGRLVTPTGLQTLSAYLIVASWSDASQALATQQARGAVRVSRGGSVGGVFQERRGKEHWKGRGSLMAVINDDAEQIHLGSRLQDAGMALLTQSFAQVGRVKVCADASPARAATMAALTLRHFMLATRGARLFLLRERGLRCSGVYDHRDVEREQRQSEKPDDS